LWLAVLSAAIYLITSSLSASSRISLTIFLIIAALIFQHFLPPNESDFHGWLTPDSLSTPPPPDSCSASQLALPNTLHIVLGNNLFYITAEQKTVDILSVNGVPILQFRRRPNGLALSGKIYDRQGAIVVIENNEFQRSKTNSFSMKRSDRHTLTIFDPWDAPVLYIHFLNPSTIYMTAKLYYPSDTNGNMEITPDGFSCFSNSIKMGGACLSGGSAICDEK
jgi:hypothetical protein